MYRVGNKVKIKVLSRYDADLIRSIRSLPNRVGIIKEAYVNKLGNNEYKIEGLDWLIGDMEVLGLVPYLFEDVYGSINDRFDILDL